MPEGNQLIFERSMSKLLKFEGLKVQTFRSGKHVQWRLWGPGGELLARGREITEVKCERRWRPLVDQYLGGKQK
jgi:hypothetical protein